MTRVFSLLLAIPVALSLASCGKQQTVEPTDQVTVIIVSPPSILLLAGDTVRFTAAVKDAQGSTVSGKSLQWSSSDTTVATVDGTGLVTAVSDGVATITAATDDVQGYAMVTVGTEHKLVWPIDCDPVHFEVWGTGFYELADPWAGPCGSNRDVPLWAFDPPWSRR